MDVIERIDRIMKERNWSDYRLSLESGLSSSTIANIHRRGTVPSISTLEQICDAFGISLSQFFAEDTRLVQLTSEQADMFDTWASISGNQKQIIHEIINEFKRYENSHLLTIYFIPFCFYDYLTNS